MSDAVLQDLIIRMAADPTFAERVRNSPTEALAGLELTADEVGRLAALSADTEGNVEALGERQSKSSLFFAGGMPHDSHPTGDPTGGGAAGFGGEGVHHVDLGLSQQQLHIDSAHIQGADPGTHDAGGAPVPDHQATEVQHPGQLQGGDIKVDSADIKLHDIGVQDQKLHDGALVADHKLGDAGAIDNKLHVGDIKIQEISDAKLHGGVGDIKVDTGDIKLHDVGVADHKIADAALVADHKIHEGALVDHKLHDAGAIDNKIHAGDIKLGGAEDVKLHDATDGKLGGAEDVKLHDAGAIDNKIHAGDSKLGGGEDVKLHDAADSKLGGAAGDSKLDNAGDSKLGGAEDVKLHDAADSKLGGAAGDSKLDNAGDSKLGGAEDVKLHDAADSKLGGAAGDSKLDNAGDSKLGGAEDVKLHDAADGKLGGAAGDSKLDNAGDSKLDSAADSKLNVGDIKIQEISDAKLHGGVGDIKLETGDIKIHDTLAADSKLHDAGVIDNKIQPGDLKLHDIGDAKIHDIGVIDHKLHDGIGDQKLHDPGSPVAGGDLGPAADPGTAHYGSPEYYGPDGQEHAIGSIQHTSTGQEYYVDAQGHGHVFYPGQGTDAAPQPGAHVDQYGMYMGVDGHLHHVGGDPSHIPTQAEVVHSDHKGVYPPGSEAEIKAGGGGYWGSDGNVHGFGAIDRASTGEQFYVDHAGHGHAFYPAAGTDTAPQPGTHVDQYGMYRGVDGHMHHVGGDPSQVPGQLNSVVEDKSGGAPGASEPGASAELKLGQGGYWGTDGHIHGYGAIEHTSTGEPYYVDHAGHGHPFYPAAGTDTAPQPGTHVDHYGMYHGIDGQMHHVGGDPSQVPGQVNQVVEDKGGGAPGPSEPGASAELKLGQGGYWGTDGHIHGYGAIEQTSTGQEYYVDHAGHGHPFYPAAGTDTAPQPGTHVDHYGMYHGIDGQMHHVGGDPSQVPGQVNQVVEEKSGGAPGASEPGASAELKLGQGGYWGTDGHIHGYGAIEQTSTGQEYYVDHAGHGHPFYPAAGTDTAPQPGTHVDHYGMYHGIDGHMHHVGGDPSQVPGQVNQVVEEKSGGAPGPSEPGASAELKLGHGGYWGTDGHIHGYGAVEQTSTGQQYFIDHQGHGHPFFPATNAQGDPIQPQPGTHVDANGMYRGVDGGMHHVGGDPGQVPGSEDLTGGFR